MGTFLLSFISSPLNLTPHILSTCLLFPHPPFHHLLLLADVRQRSIDGDAVRGEEIEAVDMVQLLHLGQLEARDLHRAAVRPGFRVRRVAVRVENLCEGRQTAGVRVMSERWTRLRLRHLLPSQSKQRGKVMDALPTPRRRSLTFLMALLFSPP